MVQISWLYIRGQEYINIKRAISDDMCRLMIATITQQKIIQLKNLCNMDMNLSY
jgi:hypothetical protein